MLFASIFVNTFFSDRVEIVKEEKEEILFPRENASRKYDLFLEF